MKKVKTNIRLSDYPEALRPFLEGAPVFDSSCSPEARVLMIDKGCGYFLKSAPKGSLEKEALLTDYFHKKGLSAPVRAYLSEDRDWLLTERIDGEDATDALYLSSPARLAETMGELLRSLHEETHADCPVQDRMKGYFATADENYKRRAFDLSYGDFYSADEAYRVMKAGEGYLKNEVLLHGDFCLPNFLMRDWRFTGFIDLGNGGVGDRHVDLFWGAWTLRFNLGTDAWRDRFFDAYGRDKVEEEALRTVMAAEIFG